MTATTKEIVEFVGGALRWLLNVGVVVMLFFGVAIMLWTLGLRARGGMRGEGWRLTWEPTNMPLAVYDGYIESVACLGSREALPHASRRHRKQGFSVFAQGGYMLFGIAWLPQYSIWWHSIRYTPHVHARGPDSFRAFLVTRVRGPTHTWPWYRDRPEMNHVLRTGEIATHTHLGT